jgi:hypothetical protein
MGMGTFEIGTSIIVIMGIALRLDLAARTAASRYDRLLRSVQGLIEKRAQRPSSSSGRGTPTVTILPLMMRNSHSLDTLLPVRVLVLMWPVLMIVRLSGIRLHVAGKYTQPNRETAAEHR